MHSRRLPAGEFAVIVVLLAVSFSVLLVGAPGVRADHNTVQWDVRNPVTSTTGVSEAWPVIVADHQGNLYAFYVSPSSGVQANVSVTKYHITATNGLAFQFTHTVNPVLGSVNQYPPISATMDNNGYLYVAWTESSGFTGGLSDEVMVTRSTDGGNTWAQTTAADRVNSYGSDYNPVIVASPDGTLSVLWLVNWGSSINVAYSRSTNQGATFTGFMNLTNQGPTFPSYWPDMAVDSHGRIHVIYEYYNSPYGVYTLNYTWSDDGATWSPAVPIVASTTLGSYVPKLAVDSHDHVHATWFSAIQTPLGTYSIQYRMSADRGATWSPQIAVNQGLVATETFPSVVTTGSTVMVVGAYSSGVDYAVSADGGASFYPERAQAIAYTMWTPREAVDQNGTIWMVYQYYNSGISSYEIGLASWHAPPSAPVITALTAGKTSLTVSWTASPEADVAEYRVYRSSDGSNYQIVATVPAGTTEYADQGLANGTYWYQVDAVDSTGLASHASPSWSGTVGVTVQQLENEITALQNALASANANLASIQTQLNSVKSQLASVQGNTTALQNQISNLQTQLNNMQSQQATQTISYANLAFEIIVVVLLVVLLLNQMRKPKNPKLMMAQPGQAASKGPDDDL